MVFQVSLYNVDKFTKLHVILKQPILVLSDSVSKHLNVMYLLNWNKGTLAVGNHICEVEPGRDCNTKYLEQRAFKELATKALKVFTETTANAQAWLGKVH